MNMIENIEQMSDEQIMTRCKEIYKQYSDDELKIVLGKDYHMFIELVMDLLALEEMKKSNE